MFEGKLSNLKLNGGVPVAFRLVPVDATTLSFMQHNQVSLSMTFTTVMLSVIMLSIAIRRAILLSAAMLNVAGVSLC